MNILMINIREHGPYSASADQQVNGHGKAVIFPHINQTNKHHYIRRVSLLLVSGDCFNEYTKIDLGHAGGSSQRHYIAILGN